MPWRVTANDFTSFTNLQLISLLVGIVFQDVYQLVRRRSSFFSILLPLTVFTLVSSSLYTTFLFLNLLCSYPKWTIPLKSLWRKHYIVSPNCLLSFIFSHRKMLRECIFELKIWTFLLSSIRLWLYWQSSTNSISGAYFSQKANENPKNFNFINFPKSSYLVIFMLNTTKDLSFGSKGKTTDEPII